MVTAIADTARDAVMCARDTPKGRLHAWVRGSGPTPTDNNGTARPRRSPTAPKRSHPGTADAAAAYEVRTQHTGPRHAGIPRIPEDRRTARRLLASPCSSCAESAPCNARSRPPGARRASKRAPGAYCARRRTDRPCRISGATHPPVAAVSGTAPAIPPAPAAQVHMRGASRTTQAAATDRIIARGHGSFEKAAGRNGALQLQVLHEP